MNKFKLLITPSLVFAFDAGPARIIILNSGKSPSSNVAFLEREINATKQLWKIVVTTTPYTQARQYMTPMIPNRSSLTTVR